MIYQTSLERLTPPVSNCKTAGSYNEVALRYATINYNCGSVNPIASLSSTSRCTKMTQTDLMALFSRAGSNDIVNSGNYPRSRSFAGTIKFYDERQCMVVHVPFKTYKSFTPAKLPLWGHLQSFTVAFMMHTQLANHRISFSKGRLKLMCYCKGRNFRRRKISYFSLENLSYGI